MAKAIHLSLIVLAGLTVSNMAQARQKFVPPADIGNTGTIDLMGGNTGNSSVVVETQGSEWRPAQEEVYVDDTQYGPSTATVTQTTRAAVTPVVEEEQVQPVAQVASGDALPNRPDSFFQPLRYVDLRDVANPAYNKIELVGAATLIMRVMENEPSRFVGPAMGLKINPNVTTPIRFLVSGPKGPEGHEETVVDGQGVERKVFKVDVSNEDTIKNTILGAEFEGIREVRREDGAGAKIVDLNMILFVRDDSGPTPNLYFRRISMRVDWTKPKPDSNQVIIYGLLQPDIPLSDTAFEAYVGLLDRKIIMMDRKNLIYKVFPVGVGSLDIRTDFGMDFVRNGSRTRPAKKSVQVDTLTGEIPNGVLTKASVWKESQWGTNTRSRTWPEYYKGRPFIGIRDISSGEPVYTLVGMHYRITTPLARAFVSHGCIRTRDQDLYQEDAILNDGPLDKMPIKVLNNLDSFYAQFNPLMPQENSWYNAVGYSTLPTDTSVSCKEVGLNQSFTVKFLGTCNVALNEYGNCPGNPEDRPDLSDRLSIVKHNFSDDECLTRVWPVQGDAAGIVEYIRGTGGYRPPTLNLDWEHFQTSGAAAEQEESQEFVFSNESGSKRRNGFNLGDLFTGIFGGGQQQQPREEPVAQPRVLSAKDKTALSNRYNEFVKCVNQNNQWRKGNGCKQGRYSAIFLDDKQKNCNQAKDNEDSCRSQAMEIGRLLGINN